MRNVLMNIGRAVIAASLLIATSAVFAQEEGPPGNLAETWVVHVKPGAQGAFEQAIKNHMAVRKANGDPFDWETYMPNTGDDLATYYFRHCCFAWADHDAYDAWENGATEVNEDWSSNVDPNVASYEHHFSEVDFENSHWPEEMSDLMFVGVATYWIKPGAWQQFQAAKNELSQLAMNNGWANDEHHWAWTSAVDGHSTVSIVFPYVNWADMADPDPSFFEFLTEQLGSAEAAAAKFAPMNDATKSTSYTIYTRRPDLSTSE